MFSKIIKFKGIFTISIILAHCKNNGAQDYQSHKYLTKNVGSSTGVTKKSDPPKQEEENEEFSDDNINDRTENKEGINNKEEEQVKEKSTVNNTKEENAVDTPDGTEESNKQDTNLDKSTSSDASTIDNSGAVSYKKKYQSIISNTKDQTSKEVARNVSMMTGNICFATDAKDLAKVLGVSKGDCQDIDQVFISYTPYLKGLVRRPLINQAKCCIKKNKSCGIEPKHHDRIAFISFGNCNKYVTWGSMDSTKVQNLSDVEDKSKKLSKNSPKIKLEMVQYQTFVHNNKFSNEKNKNYKITDKNHKQLASSMKDAVVCRDANGKPISYRYEKVIKKFWYSCYLAPGCGKSRKLRRRDAFVFLGKNECNNKELDFKEIHKLMSCGDAFNLCDSRRLIKMDSCSEKCSRCHSMIEFVWRITIYYKDKNNKTVKMVQEFLVDKNFN